MYYMPIKKPPKIDYEDNYSSIKKRKRFSCLGLFFSLIILSVFLSLAVIISVKVAINPIKQSIDNLPQNFPQDLTIYNIDQAKIEEYSKTSQDKIIELANLLPDWVVNPVLNLISDDLNNKLVNTYNNFSTATDHLTLDDLKQALDNDKIKQTQTLSLSWNNLDINQEELLNYYKQELKNNDYSFKEDIRDYEINLGFWKQGIFGNLNLSENNSKTQANMTVNYLNQEL